MLIGWDEEVEGQYLENYYNFTLHKIICNSILFVSLNFKPFMYKALTCSLCHSGYLAIYFIFAYKAHFIILPTTMVVYYLLSKIKFQ